MKPEAYDICKQYHEALLVYHRSQIRTTLNMGDLEKLSIAHGIEYGRPFPLCCDGPIANGLKNISSAYVKHINNG